MSKSKNKPDFLKSTWWIYNEVRICTKHRKHKEGKVWTWENMRLIEAGSAAEAYRKAIKISSEFLPFSDHIGYWEFGGITMLVPVYDLFEDGVELVWYHCGYQPREKVRRAVKSKAWLLKNVKGPRCRIPVKPPNWASHAKKS